MAEVMVMWEEQVPHAETKMGGIHIASLCLSPLPLSNHSTLEQSKM